MIIHAIRSHVDFNILYCVAIVMIAEHGAIWGLHILPKITFEYLWKKELIIDSFSLSNLVKYFLVR